MPRSRWRRSWPAAGAATRSLGWHCFAASVIGHFAGDAHASATIAGNVEATTTATTSTPPPAGAYWPFEKLVARLAGRTLALPRGPVRLDGALLECNGEGTTVRSRRSAGWSRYTCTQTMFGRGGDQDVTFEVVIENATQLRIVSPRYGAQ